MADARVKDSDRHLSVPWAEWSDGFGCRKLTSLMNQGVTHKIKTELVGVSRNIRRMRELIDQVAGPVST
jgi:hypothetical protein